MEIEEKKIRCLFGTDGVRDVANRGVMTPEMALRLGRAYVLFLTEKGVPRPDIMVGRDTRRSGQMLEAALSSGLASAGAEVMTLGVAPTPEVSYAVREHEVQGGVVISASHNPAEYNGIKFLDRNGRKLSDDDEACIEDYLGDNFLDDWRPTGASIGKIIAREDIHSSYAAWLLSLLQDLPLSRFKCVFDTAHGAASDTMKYLLTFLPRNWELYGADPDGLNINDGVGVMDLEYLSAKVITQKAHLGFAYDGDADRVQIVDSKGRHIDGDIMLWVLGRWLRNKERLGSGVTATVMSNLALEDHLNKEGIKVFRCPVGDRYVFQTMISESSRIGGEQSGHVILSDYTTTGDGLCTGFLFLRACIELGENIDTLIDRFDRYPQSLRNVFVPDIKTLLDSPNLKNVIEQASRTLEGKGRIFIRPSGTEPLVRVLVEAKDRELVNLVAEELVGCINSLIS